MKYPYITVFFAFHIVRGNDLK